MAIEVICHFQSTQWACRADFDTDVSRAIQTVRDLGVSALRIVDLSGLGLNKTEGNITVTYHPSVDEALAVTPASYVRVFLETQSDYNASQLMDPSLEPLKQFVHPSNAVYVLGRESGSAVISSSRIRSGDKAVRIDYGTSYVLWSHIAMAIVLYDRIHKV